MHVIVFSYYCHVKNGILWPLTRTRRRWPHRNICKKGQYDRAIREYVRILKEDPKDIKVRQKLGDIYAREDKKEEAVAEYNYVANYYSDDGFLSSGNRRLQANPEA